MSARPEPDPDAVFAMLGDRTRREILALLRREDRVSASAVAARFPYLSRSAVSAKLSQLRRAGLVFEVREGSYRLYSLAGVRPVEAVAFVVDLWGSESASSADVTMS